MTPDVAERLLQLGRHDGRDRSGGRRRRRRDQLLDLGHVDRVHELGRGVVPVRRSRGRVRQRLGRQQRPGRQRRSRTRARGSPRRLRARTTATASGTRHDRRHHLQRRLVGRNARRPARWSSTARRSLGALPTEAGATPDQQMRLCYHGCVPPSPGKIVVCERGVNARIDKSLAVLNAGGVGMIMVNADAELGQRRPALRPVDPPGEQRLVRLRSRRRRRPARRRRSTKGDDRLRRGRAVHGVVLVRAARSRPAAATS